MWAENKSGQRCCYCVCSRLLRPFLKHLLWLNFSVHYKRNHWGMMLLWRAESQHQSSNRVQKWTGTGTGTPLWPGCRGFGAHVTGAVQFEGVFWQLWAAGWLMRTTRCFCQMERRLASCGCWLRRILQQEVSQKYPNAFSETQIICVAPRFSAAMWDCGAFCYRQVC